MTIRVSDTSPGASRAGGPPSFSRRSFVRGGAGALALGAAATAGALSLSGCGDDEEEEVQTLEVDEGDVVTLDSFTAYKHPTTQYSMYRLGSYSGGTLIHATSESVAAAIVPGDSADPLNRLALLGLDSGRLLVVRQKPVGYNDGYMFLSATASSELIVWVESNFLTSRWRVYCAPVKEKQLDIGKPVKLDAGGSDYDAPKIEAIDSTAYWIVQPSEDGSKTTEDSHLMASEGGSEATVIHTSHGRFNGGLAASDGILTAMPRVDTSGVYYQLTAFQSGTGKIVDTLVMPQSFKPSSAIYMDGAFAFTIEAAYDYGGGIANVGTYYPLDDGTYLRLTKQPVTPPALCRGWLVSKSGSRTVFVNMKERKYFTVDAPDGTADYGDYPLAYGEVRHVFVYSSITRDVETDDEEDEEEDVLGAEDGGSEKRGAEEEDGDSEETDGEDSDGGDSASDEDDESGDGEKSKKKKKSEAEKKAEAEAKAKAEEEASIEEILDPDFDDEDSEEAGSVTKVVVRRIIPKQI